MAELIDLLQWPAMAITLFGAWWLASRKSGKRLVGFWSMVVANVLWIAWGWGAEAWAVVVMQVGLMALNIRGIVKNEH